MVEGAPHTAKRSMINCCVYGVPPSPVYKGVEEGAGQGGWRALRGSPTPTGSRTPLFPIRSRRGKEEEGGRKGGAGPPPNSDWAWGAPPPLLLSTKAQ